MGALDNVFQSTLPAGGATDAAPVGHRDVNISIHAPRGGSDYTICTMALNFSTFQSTLPAGGATAKTTHRGHL